MTQLGEKTILPSSPDVAALETFANPADANTFYCIRFACPEFTSLCPKTGQPDFAHIVIDYVPHHACVESKSLKLFLGSFRSHGAFHEACTLEIASRLFQAMLPHWIRVASFFYPRGGISIDCFKTIGVLPNGVYIPPLDVPMLRGRG